MCNWSLEIDEEKYLITTIIEKYLYIKDIVHYKN